MANIPAIVTGFSICPWYSSVSELQCLIRARINVRVFAMYMMF